MDNLNLIVMGKTGAGKSTLINSVLGENAAPTGIGQKVTTENKLYSRRMRLPLGKKPADNETYKMVWKTVNLYDTVGLEIDSSITKNTLRETKELIKKTRVNEMGNDITLVWFCVDWLSNRFENYEVNLIRSLTMEYEIPFVLVLTKCFSNETSKLEKQLKYDLPQIPVSRVLAEDYTLRTETVRSYGIMELIQQSVWNYNNRKIKILTEKLSKLYEDTDRRIDAIRTAGIECVKSYSDKAAKIGFVPVVCIPFVHGICISMIMKLNETAGINSTKGFATEIFENVIIGLIATPMMLIPVLSAAAASAYVETVGEDYLDALMMVIERSTNEELKNNKLMAERIKAEIQKRKE